MVNQSLYYFLQNVKHQFNESQWQVIVELIKMQPTWEAKKYSALKKFEISPREYEFITEEVSNYWRIRLKEISVEKLEKSGWELFAANFEEIDQTVNYDLFLSKDDQLNNLFTMFLTPSVMNLFGGEDSSLTADDSLEMKGIPAKSMRE